jgi:hypothetical protein
MAILSEGKERLELIGMLLSDSSKRREAIEATNSHRDDVVSMMVNQRDLEKEFDLLMSRRSELRGLSNKTKYNENEAAIKTLISQLQQSQTNITSQLSDQPSRLNNLHKLQRDRHLLSTAVSSTIDDLAASGSYGQLLHFISSRMEEDRVLDESRRTEEKNLRALALLELELAQEEEAFQQSVQENAALVQKLAAELKHLKQVSSTQIQYRSDATEAALEAHRREHALAAERLRAEMDGVHRELALDERGFERATAFAEKQRVELEAVHEDWQAKLKADTASRGALVGRMRELRSVQKARLQQLSESWEQAVDEKTMQTNMLRQRTIEAEARRALADRMDWAQRCIRFHWLAYKARRDAQRAAARKKRAKSKRAAAAKK